jgi:hypothetical protein
MRSHGRRAYLHLMKSTASVYLVVLTTDLSIMSDLDDNTSTDNSSDDASIDSYDRYHATLLAHACEWCSQDQCGGICNGRGKECRAMASYRQAQSCARMNYLCRDTIRMQPTHTSLQTRIVDVVQKSVHAKHLR